MTHNIFPTPGPWLIRPGIKNDVIALDGKLIATAYPGLTRDGYIDKATLPEAEANAAIMAAAWELLLAAEFACENLDHSGCDQVLCPRCDLEAAIVKARGGL